MRLSKTPVAGELLSVRKEPSSHIPFPHCELLSFKFAPEHFGSTVAHSVLRASGNCHIYRRLVERDICSNLDMCRLYTHPVSYSIQQKIIP